MQYPFLSLVIPCYEESARVDRMLRELNNFLTKWPSRVEVLIIDDGSKDQTASMIQQHPLFDAKRMRVLSQHNTGKGGALKMGVAQTQGDFILTLDADMATSPNQLFSWLETINEFKMDEILIGSREVNKNLVSDKKHREFIGHVFNAIIRSFSGLKIKDTQCGFKLYPASIGKLLFSEMKTLGWAHDVELLVLAKRKKITVVEMPVKWTAIEGSKINILRDSWAMFWEVVKIGR